MVVAVYISVALTTLLCGILLLRGYLRSRARLLLWSGMCFLFLSLSNVLLYLDLAVIDTVSLYLPRLLAATVGMLFLLYGLIWEHK
jgi:hypothetical protein